MSKQKFERRLAAEVARELYETLNHSCERLKVAGSLRRGAQQVGDIEFLAIPYFAEIKMGLFEDSIERLDRFSSALDSLIRLNVLRKRLSDTGHETWGIQNKLAVHVASGIPVDFFTTTPENWFMALVIRTGPKELNIQLATAAKKKGWRLNAYGSGYSLPDGSKCICESEQDVFTAVGLAYRAPEHRR